MKCVVCCGVFEISGWQAGTLSYMRNRLITFLIILVIALGTSLGPITCSQGSSRGSSPAKSETKPRSYSRKPSSEALQWADKQLRQMSLDEKIGQLGIHAVPAPR